MSEETRERAYGILRHFAERLMANAQAAAISSERLTETVLGLVEKSQALGDIDTAARLLDHFGSRLRRDSHVERLDASYASVLAHENLPAERRLNLAERYVQLLTHMGRRAEAEIVLAAAWPYAQTPASRARLYNRHGYLLYSYGEYKLAQAAYEMGLTEAHEVHDLAFVCIIHSNLGEIYFADERNHEAVAAFTKAIEIARHLPDPFFRAIAEGGMAMTLTALAQFDDADTYHEVARQHYQLCDDVYGLVRTDLNQSYNANARGDYLRARSLSTRALAQAREMGDLHHVAVAQHNLGEASLGLREYEIACEHFLQALDMRLAMGKPVFVERTSRSLQDLVDLVDTDSALPSLTQASLLRRCRDGLKAAQAILKQPSTPSSA